jgi:HSP20 family protein
MAIMKWDPLRELHSMQEQMDRLFELSRKRALGEPLEPTLWQPAVDIYEDAREVVVKMEVPEIEQKDIDVQIEEDRLIICGERRLEREESRQNYHRIERSYGPFRRSFALPAAVEQGQIRASIEQGVLKIVLPKRSSGQPRQIEVEVR